MYPQPVSVAILGGGAGSNADALIRHGLQAEAPYRVRLVISTKSDAGIVGIAHSHGITCVVLPKDGWEESLDLCLREHVIEVLTLAGFMRKLPESTIALLGGNVLNVHPALLPKYGGAGMYGIHVHRAVLAAGENVSGATVHKVTGIYDEGAVIAQQSLPITDNPTAEDLQQRIKHLEHEVYPRALDVFCTSLLHASGVTTAVPRQGDLR